MSDEIVCRQCGVTDATTGKPGATAAEGMFPHDCLVHYDGVGVFCPECDEWVEEENDDEEAP